MASMVVPLVKLAGLFFLVLSSIARRGRRLRWRTGLYKFIDAVGPWAMLDVFLLAVLVSLVKLGQTAQACKAYQELTEVYGPTMRPQLKQMLPSALIEAKCK